MLMAVLPKQALKWGLSGKGEAYIQAYILGQGTIAALNYVGLNEVLSNFARRRQQAS